MKSILQDLKSRLNALSVGIFFRGDEKWDINVSDEDLFADLELHKGNDRLLGRYTEDEVRNALIEYGVWDRLAEKGYADAHLVIQSIDPFRQRIRILSSPDAPDVQESILCELRVFDAWLNGPCPLTGKKFEVDALVIDWLMFQNPNSSFSEDKPRLPGQRFPGLGIMRNSMRAIIDLARRVQKEAVIGIPEYYHNAVLYGQAFRFFSAYVEGRFQALKKFVSNLSLAEASNSISKLRIFNATKNEMFVWKPHEQILPLVPRIHAYFTSSLYLEKVKEAEAESKFVFKD